MPQSHSSKDSSSQNLQAYSQKDIERQSEALANRVKKSYKRLAKKFLKQDIQAFRLYHWDIPEIRAIVDWYDGHLVIGEYVRRQTEGIAWLEAMGAAVAEALGVPAKQLHLKRRRTRPQGEERYQRLARTEQRFPVGERDLRFLVNLDDYLDTGLFPDHRDTRMRIRQESHDRRFLNLFAYTASFTAYAIAGGARSSVSVDLSQNYLDWAKENLELNSLYRPDSDHLVRADSMTFLHEAATSGKKWDLIFIDPPSFSTRGATVVFDVQRDHSKLLLAAKKVLAPGGILYFSTNHQRFEPQFGAEGDLWEEITDLTVPEDFRRMPPHRCFRYSENLS